MMGVARSDGPPQLCDVWLARFLVNIVDTFPVTEELVDLVASRLPQGMPGALNESVSLFAQEKGERLQALRTRMGGGFDEFWARVYALPGLDRIRALLDEIHRPSFPEFLQVLDGDSAGFEVRPFLRALVAEWIEAPCRLDPEQEAALRRPEERLNGMFNLQEKEMACIMFLFCKAHDPVFRSFCDFDESTHERVDLARVLGISAPEVTELFSVSGTLRAAGLVDYEHTRHGRTLELDQGVNDYLEGIAQEPFQAMVEPMGTPRFPLESFPVDAESTSIIMDLFSGDQARHVLIHGAPGVGKTEYAQALAARTGRQVYLLKMGTAEEGRSKRLAALAAVSRVASGERTLIILDECDDLLATEQRGFMGLFGGSGPGRSGGLGGGSGKEWLNRFLDGSGICTLWIANDVSGMHDSVKRRFSYALHFGPPPLRHRLAVWAQAATDAGFPALAEDAEARALVRVFSPSPADIAAVFDVLRASPPDTHLARMRRVLGERRAFQSEDGDLPATAESGGGAGGTGATYDPETLVCSVPPADLLRAVRAACEGRQPLSLLFHGAPGTGKTELARYLARASGYALESHPASDLLSPYVGQAEKNIAKMFERATATESILLLDEIDSFLQDRRGAHRSWEITQVNELLTQMERFRGVFIACTNFLDKLDPATMRRFVFKVGFSALDDSGRVRLFERYFPEIALDDEARRMLARVDGLSPGDFRTVKRMRDAIAGFGLALVDPHGTEDDAPRIVAALANEAEMRAASSRARVILGFGT